MGHGYETKRKAREAGLTGVATAEFKIVNGSHRAAKELTTEVRKKLKAITKDKYRLSLPHEELIPTANQKEIVDLIGTKDVVFINGPLGTGKTVWSCYGVLKGFAENRFDYIALTAPAVEAEEKLGFMPGTKDEKMEEHVSQILETIDDLIGKDLRLEMQAAGLLEIAPHAFNRGKTYKRAAYLLDESQNATKKQLYTSLGRLGLGSTFVYMGDDAQNDRTNTQSPYVKFMAKFTQAAYEQEIGSVTMGVEDVRRHPLLKKMIERGDFNPNVDIMPPVKSAVPTPV